MYLSNFAALVAVSSWQLSGLVNNSGTPFSGATTAASARALPTPGFFHVPVAGSATSVAYEAMEPIPPVRPRRHGPRRLFGHRVVAGGRP
ncbi:hypothetical protein [Streptomyces sp. NPDC055006]